MSSSAEQSGGQPPHQRPSAPLADISRSRGIDAVDLAPFRPGYAGQNQSRSHHQGNHGPDDGRLRQTGSQPERPSDHAPACQPPRNLRDQRSHLDSSRLTPFNGKLINWSRAKSMPRLNEECQSTRRGPRARADPEGVIVVARRTGPFFIL